MSEAMILLHHGTQPARLSVGAIVSTAESNLRNREFNRELLKRRRERKGGWDETIRRYAFHPCHLRGCASAAEVLTKAVDDYERGQATTLLGRARVYHDVDLLRAALGRAKAAK